MLEVLSLSVHFGAEIAVDSISFSLANGEILGIVGESGSGKTLTALSIMGILRENAHATGRILFDNRDLLTLSPQDRQNIQGREIAMVFQEAMTSLNPLVRVGRQIEEAMAVHVKSRKGERRAAAFEAMAMVELPDPERIYTAYPHELSGGMRQRAMLAAAILLRPRLLICDEPTTALDVTAQLQILDLLRKLNQELGLGILFISHDLHAVLRLCDRAMIMQKGKIVESGDVETLFSEPQTEYTKKLLASMPERGVRRGETNP